MDRLFKSTWFVKIISFLIALMLFTVVSSEEQTTQQGITKENQIAMKERLDVQYDKDKYVVTGYPETVSVQVKGDNNLLTKTGLIMNRRAYINLTGKDAGSYSVKVMTDGYPSGLAVNVVPSSVQVDIEKKETKEFSASLDLLNQNKLEDGYHLGNPELSADKVQVTGGKKEVNSIAFIKGVVDVKGADSAISRRVNLNAYDVNGNQLSVEINPATINVKIPVESPGKTVPLNLKTTGKLPDGVALSSIDLSQNEVSLYGPKNVLDNIEQIDDFELSLDNIKSDTQVPLDIPLPKGIEKVDPATITANVHVAPETTKQFKGIPIEVLGLSDSSQIEFVDLKDQSIDMELKGAKDVLSQINREDIEIYIDVTGLKNGDHTVKLKANKPDYVTVNLAQENVDITLSNGG